jgi:predicted anti-sigma-YlaC factor YlaD
MNVGQHESFQHMIDESLAGALSAERGQSLHEHLQTCASCREYLNASNRVVAGLGGFSFEVDPTLNARVFAALRQRAQQVQVAHPGRAQWVLICLAAVVLTMVGSFIDLQFGRLIASVLDIQHTHVQQGLFDFWIAPASLVLLLFPLLPVLSKASTRRKERAL